MYYVIASEHSERSNLPVKYEIASSQLTLLAMT